MYLGKPLVLIVDNAWFPVDQGRFDALAPSYTLRKMWGLNVNLESTWSVLQRCLPGFLESSATQPCHQSVSQRNGQPEQLSVGLAYQETYISDKRTAVPKFSGKTFLRQFATLFDYPGLPIVTIAGWNEWIAQRFCLDAGGNPPDDPSQCVTDQFPDGSRIFVDEYAHEYNRDVEPS